jgi:hypothetical protein
MSEMPDEIIAWGNGTVGGWGAKTDSCDGADKYHHARVVAAKERGILNPTEEKTNAD